MKKWIIIINILFLLCACSKSTKDEDVYYKFHKKIANIESYTCTAYMKVYGNKSPKEYVLKHYYKSPDYYKLDVLKPENIKHKKVIYEGNKVFVENPNVNDEFKLTYNQKENKYLFIGDFISNMLGNEKLDISYDDNNLILSTSIGGNNIYFNKERLYIDKKTLKPFKLQILDNNSKKRFEIKYTNFKYNEGGL